MRRRNLNMANDNFNLLMQHNRLYMNINFQADIILFATQSSLREGTRDETLCVKARNIYSNQIK